MRLFKNPNIDFVNKRYIFFGISVVLMVVCLMSIIIHGGFNLGIDFTGGILLEIKFTKPIQLEVIRQTLTKSEVPTFELQSFPERNSILIRVKGTQEILETISTKIQSALGEFVQQNDTINFVIERTEFVGPRIGKYLVNRTILAVIFSFLGIIVYVAFRFKSTVWGVSGVIALAHDVLITLGLFSLFNKEVTLTVIAAVLTLAGYSINDTIVIFDRIRENLSLIRKEPLDKIINVSINQTISRTCITSLTTELVLIALFFLGGKVIHDFAFALLFGIIIGTYSSIFVASPLVYEWLTYRTRTRK